MYGCIDLANIDEASNVEVSDIMTYDEMVAYYAERRVFLLKRPKWHLAHRKEIFLPAILPTALIV